MQPKTPQRRTNFRKANRSMPRRRVDLNLEAIDYKNPDLLKRFVTAGSPACPPASTVKSRARSSVRAPCF